MNISLQRRFAYAAFLLLIHATSATSQFWTEGWEAAPLGTRTPPAEIEGDRDTWSLGDTASHCGVRSNRASILSAGGNKFLRLATSEHPGVVLTICT